MKNNEKKHSHVHTYTHTHTPTHCHSYTPLGDLIVLLIRLSNTVT